MPEVRNTDEESAWYLKDDDTAIVYMCGTDWQHHTLCDVFGTTVYPSEKALRENKKQCVDECGIVEIEMKVKCWVQPQDFSEKG